MAQNPHNFLAISAWYTGHKLLLFIYNSFHPQIKSFRNFLLFFQIIGSSLCLENLLFDFPD